MPMPFWSDVTEVRRETSDQESEKVAHTAPSGHLT